MTPAEALTRLQSMLAWDADPELSTDEVTSLLSMSALADAYGYAPSDVAWTPTYNLYRGAAEGWRWKAAKCANRTNVSADGTSIQEATLFEHCLAQVEHYAKRAGAGGGGATSFRTSGYGSLTTGVSAPYES